MKTIITFAAATALFAGQAIAGSVFDNHASYGTVLLDLEQPVHPSAEFVPGVHPSDELYSSADYGSVLYDLDQPSSPAVATQPSIGDEADDYGSILYDIDTSF